MSSPSRTPSYFVVLRTPHARRVFGAALLGRLSYGITPLSLILALTDATGSYAVAGGVMAAFAFTVSALAPVRAGADRQVRPAPDAPADGRGVRAGAGRSGRCDLAARRAWITPGRS